MKVDTVYNKTHKFFAVNKPWTESGWTEIQYCREYLGDNNPFQPLQDRPWFTSYNGIWVRNDCVDPAIVTWFGLQQPHS